MPVPSFTRLLMLSCIIAALSAESAGAQKTDPPLALEARIPLKNVTGRIDHLSIDLVRRRLFVAELGNNSVDVIDLERRQVMRRMDKLKSPQGIAYVAGRDILAVANAGDGTVALFGGAELTALGSLKLGDDADNIRVVNQSGQIVIGYGSGGLARVDLVTRAITVNVKLAAHPEGFQLSNDGARAYVNITDAKQIAVVDLAGGRQVAAWTVPGLSANFPMAIDKSGASIALVYRSPAKLVLLDTASGKVKSQADTCGDADDVFFDARRGRIYVSCGGDGGAIDVFDASSVTDPKPVARIATSPGARTSLFVPELDRLYVAARGGVVWGDASILVFRPNP